MAEDEDCGPRNLKRKTGGNWTRKLGDECSSNCSPKVRDGSRRGDGKRAIVARGRKGWPGPIAEEVMRVNIGHKM